MYEYECTKCGHRFELIQKFSDRPKTKCPKCRGTLRKLISTSSIQFKGSGWYVTDYAKGSSAGRAEKLPEGSAGDEKSAGKSLEKGTDKSGEKGGGRSGEKGKSEEKAPSKEKSGGKKDSG